MVLLERVAAEEAEELDDNAPKRVSRRPTLLRVQNRSTDIAPKNVGVSDARLDGNIRGVQWILFAEVDGQV